jgi:hypothetical protein
MECNHKTCKPLTLLTENHTKMYKYYDNEDRKHYHELDGEPLLGASTICKVFPKVLTYWASGLACKEMGWNNPKDMPLERRIKLAGDSLEEIKTFTPEQYLNKLDVAYKAHAQRLTDSASAGTDLHSTLEHFVKTGEIKDDKILPFVNWAKENVKKWLWSESHCYSKELWAGGISDVGAELNTGDYIIIDFKSAKDVYYSQFVQTVIYAIMIEENGILDKDGNLVKKLDKEIKGVCIVPFGAKVVEPKFNWDMEELKTTAKLATNMYKILLRNNAI